MLTSLPPQQLQGLFEQETAGQGYLSLAEADESDDGLLSGYGSLEGCRLAALGQKLTNKLIHLATDTAKEPVQSYLQGI